MKYKYIKGSSTFSFFITYQRTPYNFQKGTWGYSIFVISITSDDFNFINLKNCKREIEN